MGYTTDFVGQFKIEPALKTEDIEFLQKFNDTRRMKRVGLDPKYGVDGEWYCGSGDAGQGHEDNIVDYNTPPSTQPGLWCQWRPTDDGAYLEWDEGEKFYEYEVWLDYLIENYLKPRGYVLNGTVQWQGESFDDRGALMVKDNVLETCGASEIEDLIETEEKKWKEIVSLKLDKVIRIFDELLTERPSQSWMPMLFAARDKVIAMKEEE